MPNPELILLLLLKLIQGMRYQAKLYILAIIF